jgi:hypothetical protein
MMEILGHLENIQRPGLLMRAARIGVQYYRRERHLRGLLGTPHLPQHSVALDKLAEIESEMDARRMDRNAGYSVARHLEVLTAMVGEARQMLSATTGETTADIAQLNASASADLRSATNASSASPMAGSSAGC